MKILSENSNKSWLAIFLLCWFFGIWGIHRFYVGKVGTGLIQLLTFGGLCIWAIADFIVIICGNFKDCNGKRIPIRL